MKQPPNFETLVYQKGKEIFDRTGSQPAQIFNRNWWYGKMMEQCIQNENLKVQMFRFIDVLPYLKEVEEVSRHIKEYFLDTGLELPQFLRWGMGSLTSVPLISKLATHEIKKNITKFANVFIAGANPEDSIAILKQQRIKGYSFTTDLLGEAALSEVESDEYQKRYLALLEKLEQEVNVWEENPQLDMGIKGKLPRINISIKVSAMYSQIDPVNHKGSVAKIKERLKPIFIKAKDASAFFKFRS